MYARQHESFLSLTGCYIFKISEPSYVFFFPKSLLPHVAYDVQLPYEVLVFAFPKRVQFVRR